MSTNDSSENSEHSGEGPVAPNEWEVWFRTYAPRLFLYARQWTPSDSDAEDALQEGFVRFWKHQRHLPGDRLAQVLISIKRAAFDLGRSRSKRLARETRVALETEAESNASTSSWFRAAGIEGEPTEEIETALRRLPEEQRVVLVLKIWLGLTFSEIAEHLDISPNTAASRYSYALNALRRQLSSCSSRDL